MGALTISAATAALNRFRPHSLLRHAGRSGAWVAYGWRRGGALLIAGGLCFACAAGLAVDAACTVQDNGRLRTALRLLKRSADHDSKAADVARPGAAAQLETFFEQLPKRDALPGEVQRLFTLARRNDLNLETGEYHANPDQAAGLLRYSITLPVRGPATAVLRFVLQALNESPSLGLAGIAFKRGDSIDGRKAPQQASLQVPPLPPLPPDFSSVAEAPGRSVVSSASLAHDAHDAVQVGRIDVPPIRAIPLDSSRESVAPSGRTAAGPHLVTASDLEARVRFVLLVRLP